MTGISTQEKLLSVKQIQKDYENYFGMYIAVDDKDRIIALGRNRNKVREEAYNFFNNYSPIQFKIYKILDSYQNTIIKSLLDGVL